MPENVVLFVCIENACRSLMAEAMFNSEPPPGWVAISAGTMPARSPNPRTAVMLEEVGLRLPSHGPQLLTPQMIEGARIRITMGCIDDESCPARLKELEYRDWGLKDPAKQDDAGFREIRNTLSELVLGLKREIRLSDKQRAARVSKK